MSDVGRLHHSLARVRTQELDSRRGQIHRDVVKTAWLDISVNLHSGAGKCSHKQPPILEVCCCFVREQMLGQNDMQPLTMLYAVTLSSTCSAAPRVNAASTLASGHLNGTLFRVAFSRR